MAAVARISRLSGGPVWASFRISNPVSGDVNLLEAQDDGMGGTIPAPVDIAIVRREPADSDWVVASFESDPMIDCGQTYYVARREVVADSLSTGTYQVWVRVVHTATEVFRVDDLDVY